MRGLYLYCIRPRTSVNSVRDREKTDSEFSLEGLDGGRIWTLPYQELEAVLSPVSLEKFASEEIQRKAQEDLKWITKKARLHQKIVEQAMKKEGGVLSVIPMKFGTIFKTKENLEETLKKYYSKFQETLENLRGMQEWAVKVYLDRPALEKEVKEISPVIQEKEKEIRKLPEGMAYFSQKQIDEAVLKETDEVLEYYIENFFESLKKYTASSARGKILEKELTGKSLPMVLNAIFLVSGEKLEDFQEEIDKLKKEYRAIGFNFESSGPWPAYNFIES